MNLENDSKLISAAVWLATIKGITIIQDNGPYPLRAPMHIFLRGKPGVTKSTVLDYLSGMFGVPVFTSITMPGLTGSIDANKNRIEPNAWTVRNKVLLLDEYSVNGNNSCIDALNMLMEGKQSYSRKLSRAHDDWSDKDGDLWISYIKGTISFRTRFSVIFASMKQLEKNRSIEAAAMLSRCIYIDFDIPHEMMRAVANGKKVFNIDTTRFNIVNKGKGKKATASLKMGNDIFTVTNNEYHLIQDKIERCPDFKPGISYLRMLNDCVRYYVYNNMTHDDLMYAYIVRCHIDGYEIMKSVLS